MRRNCLELGKTVLILLLAVSALILLLLGNLSASHLRSAQSGGSQADLPLVDRPAQIATAAFPVAISARGAAGRSSAIADDGALEERYRLLGSLLGEALATAHDGAEVEAGRYQAALGGIGVCFLYQGVMPVGTLGDWLGARWSGSSSVADQLLLSVSGDQVDLYLADTASARYDRYATLARADALRTLLDGFLPDNSAFAFEAQDAACAALAPFTLLPLGEDPAVYEIAATPLSGARFTAQAATSLGMNAYGAYTDTNGATVYNETGFTLRLDTDGTLWLRNSLQDDPRFTANTLTAKIERVKALLDGFTAGQLGNADLYFSGWNEEEGRVTITFDYLVGGVPLLSNGGSAAVAVFAGTTLTSLSLFARNYVRSATRLPLLPVRQAAALVPPGSTLVLYYAEGATVYAGWRAE